MTKDEIGLRDVVKDEITGFEGTVVCIAHWMNGCTRVSVQPSKLNKDGQPRDFVTLDVEQLKLIKRSKVVDDKPHGGPRPDAPRRRDQR